MTRNNKLMALLIKRTRKRKVGVPVRAVKAVKQVKAAKPAIPANPVKSATQAKVLGTANLAAVLAQRTMTMPVMELWYE